MQMLFVANARKENLPSLPPRTIRMEGNNLPISDTTPIFYRDIIVIEVQLAQIRETLKTK